MSNNNQVVPTTFEWKQTIELGYEQIPEEKDIPKSSLLLSKTCCWYCGKSSTSGDNDTAIKLSECSRCNVARYCSRDCQVADWKKSKSGGIGHKHTCAALKRVGTDMEITSIEDQISSRQDILFRIRFYACPYAVHKAITLGPGFLFVQGTSTLAEMSLPPGFAFPGGNKKRQRSVLLHYLTLGEFDVEVCRDDFELAAVRDSIKQTIDDHNNEKDMVVLMRFRCGHVAVGTCPLVPDYQLCKSLGQTYYGSGEGASSGAIQLNLDDI